MKNVSELIFRQITPADFFNINKKPKKKAKGGGQSYIDVPIKNVDLPTWHSFFGDITPEDTKSGPLWKVDIHSLGGLGSQEIEIGRRRGASVNIRSQKLFSRNSNRVFAWHPDKGGFPRAPANMTSADDPRVIELAAGVRVFILKTDDHEYWAGWLTTEEVERLSATDARFEVMLSEPAGHIHFKSVVELNEASLRDPFSLHPLETFELADTEVVEFPDENLKPGPKNNRPYNAKSGRTEDDIAAELFQDDAASSKAKKTEKVIKIFERNRKAVRDLKKLYKTCQITGDQYVFPKLNDEPYLEVHHLIPLGEGGSDHPANLVVISAHIHRMLHYANVEGIDLENISDDKLDFTINGESFTITWLPKHVKTITDAGGLPLDVE